AEGHARATPARSAKDWGLLVLEEFDRGTMHESMTQLADPKNHARGDVTGWMVLGHINMLHGRFRDAKDCYSLATMQQRDSHWPYFHRGLAGLREKDYARARADFDESVRLRPGHADSYADRAVAELALHMDAEAFLDFQRALDLDPGSIAA